LQHLAGSFSPADMYDNCINNPKCVAATTI
jgi:hypothetical protein